MPTQRSPPHAISRLLAGSSRALLVLVALLSAFGPAVAAAEDVSAWGPPASERPPQLPAAVVGRYTGPDAGGALTVELLLGAGPVGGGGGLRASVGVEPIPGWRLELGLGGWTENGDPSTRLQVSRALLDLAVARRVGRLEPWVAVGYAKVTADTDSRFDGVVARGPALALGVRVAATSHVLVGLTLRAALARALRLDPSGPPLTSGGPWLGVTLAWRS